MSETLTMDSDSMQPQYDFSNAIVGRKEDSFYLHLAAEHFVAGELIRRGVFATVTHGAAQHADVLVTDKTTGQSAVIEIKTAVHPNRRWLIGGNSVRRANISPHNFWVLVLFGATPTETVPRFFVYTSEELIRLASAEPAPGRNTHGVILADAEASQAEGCWDKIAGWLRRK